MAARERRARILCAGIGVLDEVFRVGQMPPTDSKTNASAFASVSGGNAANSAIAIARLGGRVSFAGPLGDDDTADRILAGLRRENIDCSACVRIGGAASSVSAVIINDAGERTIVTYSDQQLHSVSGEAAARHIAEFDCVLADDRRQTFVTPICKAARQRNLPVVLDVDRPAPLDDALLALATHIIFSAESLKATGTDGDLPDALRDAYATLNRFVAVTDGPRDALWCDAGGVHAMPAFPVAAVDTLAAGDVFHGAFALALVEGRDPHSGMRFAAAAAALKCMRFGGSAGAPTRAEVDSFLKQQE